MKASTHLAKLPEGWAKQFLEMYDVGCSDHEIMRKYAITPTAWKTMLNSLGESEFHEVVDYGNALAMAWWLRLGRTNINNKQFNTRLYDITMQNRFGWAQKAETTENETSVSLADDDTLDRRIKELIASEE